PLSYLDPLWVLEPAWGAAGSLDLAEGGRRLAAAAIAWGVLGTVCLTVAAARLEPLYRAELGDVRADRLRWYSQEREPIEDEPVRWLGQHVEGLAPNPTLRRVPQWLGIAGVTIASTLSSLAIL